MGVNRTYLEVQEYMRQVGFKTPSWNNAVIIAAARAKGVLVKPTSRGTTVRLESNGANHTWRWGRSTLNSLLAQKCVEHKEVASRLLLASGVVAPENAVFLVADAERAWNWARPIVPVVVKPSDGIQGRDVYVDLRGRQDFMDAFRKVAGRLGSALVEKYHEGVEHRCLVVGGKLQAVTRRRPASVLGNGRATIRELVAMKNERRGPIHKQIVIDQEARRLLSSEGLDVDGVPPDRMRVYLRRTSNLHAGGDAIDATDEISAGDREQIEAAVMAVPGLRIGGLDVLLPQSENDDPLSILEINANPMISMHHFPWEGQARDAAAAVLGEMFD